MENEKKEQYFIDNDINHWGEADTYACEIIPLKKGLHIDDFNRNQEIKKAFEAGMLKTLELLKEKQLLV